MTAGLLRCAPLLLALVLASAAAHAAGLTVTPGATVSLSGGTLDLRCTDLVVSGTFAAGSGFVQEVRDLSIDPGGVLDAGTATLQVTGDWTNAGTLLAGTSLVSLEDGCGRDAAVVTGSNDFHDLQMLTGSGKQYDLEANTIQKVSGTLTLAGSPGSRLVLRSTVPGAAGFFDLQGGQSIAWVDVEDNVVQGNPIVYGPDSRVGSNVSGWILRALPALGVIGLAVLSLAIVWGARATLREPARGGP